MQNINNDAIKQAQLSIAFEGRALDWFMGYIVQHVNASIQFINNALKQQFRKPKSYAQCVVKLKEFKQGPIEYV